MNTMLMGIITVLTAFAIIVVIDFFARWSRESLDKEYEDSLSVVKWNNCPICNEWMDISQTQRIIITKNGPEMCCISHTNREMVDYFKRVQSEE